MREKIRIFIILVFLLSLTGVYSDAKNALITHSTFANITDLKKVYDNLFWSTRYFTHTLPEENLKILVVAGDKGSGVIIEDLYVYYMFNENEWTILGYYSAGNVRASSIQILDNNLKILNESGGISVSFSLPSG